jgi:hypothetical protein
VTDIGDQINETMAELDRLHQPIRDRQAESFRQLQAIVANLDYGTPLEAEQEERPLRREPEPSAAPIVPVIDYAPRSAGDRPGGPFLRKLTDEAFRRRRW